MAQVAHRLPDNVPGDFFVDSSCIDCDACRVIAPQVFRDAGDQSAVDHQPETAEELIAAQRALISCPTASIGDLAKRNMDAALASLPEHLTDDVYRCGYTSESSFGAISYYLRDPKVLIDSPRFAAPLVRNIDALGGVNRILLTHRDDVADHDKFHERFGAERVLHRDDVHSRTSAIEMQPSGLDPIEIEDGLLMIPTPGHTKGHAVFLYRDKFLFTGDHLAWNTTRKTLYAFRSACWYSWSEQIESMRRLLAYRFEWVLPGHGRPMRLSSDEMHEHLKACIAWMRKRA
jgi:glyoxylase-like metal-dependent hydrolase (beta-lactamase superfamily II)/ferredoxin